MMQNGLESSQGGGPVFELGKDEYRRSDISSELK